MSDDCQRRFTHWAEQSAGLRGVRLGAPLAGGNSNVTRLVESDAGRFVLRHPPSETVSDRAADGIRREYAALQALHGLAPVPEPVAWCDDRSILGQPFSITRFVDGVIVCDSLPAAYGDTVRAVSETGLAMIAALAQVHRADPAPLIEQKLGRPSGFVRRQIDRWMDIRAQDAVRDLPLLRDLGEWLRRHEPPPLDSRIVHCDFHLDNCLSDPVRPGIRAIIDWEMASVADPRVDLGLALFFWARDPRQRLGFPWLQAFSNRDGVISRSDLAAHWSEQSGLPNEGLAYFMLFAAWRLAAIVEGAYVLYRKGVVDSAYARSLEENVPALLAEASALIEHGASVQ